MPSLTRRFNVRIPLRDGITLSADLTLPEVLPAPAVTRRISLSMRMRNCAAVGKPLADATVSDVAEDESTALIVD